MEIPTRMTAALLTDHGGLENLVIRDDVPVPVPASGEVLIQVGACGVNNTDINTRIGWYSRSVKNGTTASSGVQGLESGAAREATWGFGAVVFPRIQGADIAGRIAAVGDGVSPLRIGQRVLVDPWIRDPGDPGNRNLAGYLGSERDGGFARFAAVPAVNAFVIDSELSDAELATFPCSYSTAEHMLTRVGLGKGEKIVITGASGGVGSALLQLAKARGAWVLAVTRRSKAEAMRALGADGILDRDRPDIEEQIRRASPGGEIDVVADVVGGRDFPAYLDRLCRGGRYVTSGAVAGPIVELDLRTLYLKDLQLHGATVMPVGIFEKMLRRIENGQIRPLLAKAFAIRDIARAQTEFLSKAHIGNFVILPE